MTWLQTPSGRRLDLLSLDPAAVDVADIAHGLSQICRYTGGTSRHLGDGEHEAAVYTVAEHCCHCCDHCPDRLKALALLHDAAEYVIGDINGPLKALLWVGTVAGNPPVRTFRRLEEYERDLLAIILAKYGVSCTTPEWDAVMRADKRMLATERLQVYADELDWGAMPPTLPVRLRYWSGAEARAEWMERFNRHVRRA